MKLYRKGNGILLIQDNLKISLDTDDNDSYFSFVSHAHNDHLPRFVNRLYASKETITLSKFRGLRYSSIIEEDKDLSMLNSGHIFGSKSLLIKDSILYTGDICLRERGYLKGAEAVNCKILIIESTYGIEFFRFPKLDEIVSDAKRIIERNLDLHKHVILSGYELGKAQLLTYLFSKYKPLVIHDLIYEINELHKKMGLELNDDGSVRLSVAESKNLLKNEPHVIILPMNSRYTNIIKRKYGAVSIAFTGWALFKKSFGEYDYTLPLSDHSDFYELVEFVKKCNPEQVVTFHGYSKEFARYLRNIGFKAFEISENEKLDDFSG